MTTRDPAALAPDGIHAVPRSVGEGSGDPDARAGRKKPFLLVIRQGPRRKWTQVFVACGGDHPDACVRGYRRTEAAANAEPVGNDVLK